MFLMTSSGFIGVFSICRYHDTKRIHVMDLNGDGRDDICIGPESSGAWYMLESNGSKFVDRENIFRSQFTSETALKDLKVGDKFILVSNGHVLFYGGTPEAIIDCTSVGYKSKQIPVSSSRRSGNIWYDAYDHKPESANGYFEISRIINYDEAEAILTVELKNDRGEYIVAPDRYTGQMWFDSHSYFRCKEPGGSPARIQIQLRPEISNAYSLGINMGSSNSWYLSLWDWWSYSDGVMGFGSGCKPAGYNRLVWHDPRTSFDRIENSKARRANAWEIKVLKK